MSDANSVIAFLTSTEVLLPVPFAVDTVLIESGLLDSQALFQLSLWIEEQVGAPLNLETLDIVSDWNTPDAIARFIARACGQS